MTLSPDNEFEETTAVIRAEYTVIVKRMWVLYDTLTSRGLMKQTELGKSISKAVLDGIDNMLGVDSLGK